MIDNVAACHFIYDLTFHIARWSSAGLTATATRTGARTALAATRFTGFIGLLILVLVLLVLIVLILIVCHRCSPSYWLGAKRSAVLERADSVLFCAFRICITRANYGKSCRQTEKFTIVENRFRTWRIAYTDLFFLR